VAVANKEPVKMTRRIKRLAEFDLSLQIKDPTFINAPRDYQKNWLLNRSMNEFARDIYAMHDIAAGFVEGSEVQGMDDRTQAKLSDLEIMEDWQIPIMQAMAQVVTANRGDILEIGFGRGVGSGLIQQYGADSHTIIECNDSIVARFEQWRVQFPERDIDIKHGLWQDVLPQLGDFDGVFFHTYPLKESDYVEQIANSTTFAEHFFEHAASHLRKGGIFTYLSNEIDSLSRNHQRLLFKHFDSIELSMASKLNLPTQVKDQWWADSMVIVKAIK
jgi:guanidinoacetate N-methyltransferase